MVAVGLGCRRGCQAADIVGAVVAALESAGRSLQDVHALYTVDLKKDASLIVAAKTMEKPLVLLPLERLKAQAPFALTWSERVKRRLGLPSVAETAALAGACESSGPGGSARLLGPRSTRGGVACAIATTESLT